MESRYGRESLLMPNGREIADALMEQLARQLRVGARVQIPVPTTWERSSLLQRRDQVLLVERDGESLTQGG